MMDYKKIIRSRSLRLKILSFLSVIPDKPMLKIQYFLKTGRRLNLKNPKRFTEKLQWYKLYYKNPLMIQCVDKYDVREYVKSKGLEDILIPCYGVYDSPDEIDWDSLPSQFVMKDTLGGGGTSVIIVKDKATADIEELKRRAAEWVKIDAHNRGGGREWPYYSGKNHRIVIEECLRTDSDKTLTDYKFFCFDGMVYCVYVIGNREIGQHGELAIMDENFDRLPYQSITQGTMEKSPNKPQNYDYMIEIAKRISSGYPHVRVDLYNVDGTIYFGEMTFFGASGYQKYCPDEFDYMLGKQFVFPKER